MLIETMYIKSHEIDKHLKKANFLEHSRAALKREQDVSHRWPLAEMFCYLQAIRCILIRRALFELRWANVCRQRQEHFKPIQARVNRPDELPRAGSNSSS